MEREENSFHLRPHILPPLTVQKMSSDSIRTSINAERQLRQRIGTPAPQKKSPIPDDLDLDKCNEIIGNPSIKIESCKSEDRTKNQEKLRHGNAPQRMTKKPQLQPIVQKSGQIIPREDVNGNNARKENFALPGTFSPTEKVCLPNRYVPLKPIERKNSEPNEKEIQQET